MVGSGFLVGCCCFVVLLFCCLVFGCVGGFLVVWVVFWSVVFWVVCCLVFVWYCVLFECKIVDILCVD